GVPEQPLPLGLLRPLPQQLGCVVLGAGLWEPHEGAGVPRPPAGRSRRLRGGRAAPGRGRSMRPAGGAALLGALVSAVVGVAACGSSSGGAGSTAPPAPKGTFCEVVLAWSNAGVGTVNHFSRVSPDAADVGA